MLKFTRFKKLTSIFTILMMVLAFITPANVLAEENVNGQAKNLISENKVNENATNKDGCIELQILATSDVHGRFMPYDYAVNAANTKGSLAQILTAVRKYRSEYPDTTILVDAGDSIQDNSASLFLNDEVNPMMLSMNEIGYDTWTLGNHEFNWGVPKLEKVMEQFKGQVLCGNVYKPDGTRLAAPYKIVERNGVKVGIIGMTTPNIVRWDSANLKDYKVTNPIDETKAAIVEIKDKVDVIIAVNHIGENPEYGTAGSGLPEIMEACPEISVVVGGHSHSKISGNYYYNGEVFKGEDATEEVKANGTLMVVPYKWGQAVAQIKINLKEKDGKYVINNKALDITSELKLMETVEADKELSEKLQPYNQKAIDNANELIGELKGGDLVSADEINGIPTAQIHETAMIDLINKVQMHYGEVALGKKIDVAAAAAFRSDANIKEGPIKRCDMALIYKYDNGLYVLKVTGKQLKQYMEWSAAYYNQYKDGDLTISFNPEIRGYNYDMFSGVDYEIDISKPAGERIVNLSKDGKAIEDTDLLYMAVNNYRANSHLLKAGAVYNENDELPEFVLKTGNQAYGLGEGRIRDLIGKYIKEELKGVLTPEVNGNWKVVGNDWNAEKRAEAVKLINEGKIAIPASEDERTPNVKAVTVEDLSKVDSSKENTKSAAKKIDIISVNDFHGNVTEDAREKGKNMGMAKVINAVKAYKAENDNTIVVSGGDNYQGSAMSNLTHGAPVSEMFKEMGVTVSAVGNHEFDWGAKWIAKWAEDGNFDFLACNIIDKETGKPVAWAKPYKVVEKDGVKIGFIGLSTPQTAYTTLRDNVKNLEFTDLKEATEKWTEYLKSGEAPEGKVDIVIALTHVGSFQDRETKEITGEVVDSKICEVENLDAVISAHSHQAVAGLVNGKAVVQGYKYGRALGKLSISLDENGKVSEIVPEVDMLYKRKSELVADENGQAIHDKYEEELNPILGEVLGKAEKELSHERHSKGGTTVLGKWTCDVMRKASNTEIAVTNEGGLRCAIPQGDITVGKLYEVLPFDNTLVKMELKGSDLKRVVENGIDNPEIGWIEVSGITVYYDINAEFGSRVTGILLEDGTPIDMDKYYTVSTNDFMYDFGDKYDFTGAKNVDNTMKPVRDILTDEIKAVKTVSVNFKQPLLEGKASAKAVNNVYVVRIGDTLGKIGAKYGVTYQEIAKANNIKNAALIFPGDKLIIPGKTVSQKDNTYVVQLGDTLGSIGEKFGMKYEDIADYNNIKNVNLIFEGQKLVIPAN